jgi:predicted amino acid racemase
MFPALEINLSAIEENAREVARFCESDGIQIVGVTKGVCGDPKIAKAMLNGGIQILGDSRIQNIEKMRENGINAKFMLIRSPMVSEIEKVVELADYSINSELSVLKKLSEASLEHGKSHKVIIMVDVGDRREGIMPGDFASFLREARKLRGIEIVGIGTNVGCFGGVLPSTENHEVLRRLNEKAKSILGVEDLVISSGGTVVLNLLEERQSSYGINQLRIGEGILLGTDSTGNRTIPWLRQDTFVLEAEIIEVKWKPSLPEGPIGKDAFGNTPIFEDRGIRKRAILAIGKQDTEIEGLFPLYNGIEVLGGSSDHTIIDITGSKVPLEVGDTVKFKLSYPAMLRGMTSPYVHKAYI